MLRGMSQRAPTGAPPGSITTESAPGWTAEAIAIRERAIARHGGWPRWLRLRSVRGGLVSLDGPLPWVKGNRRTFRMPGHFEVFPHSREVFFGDAPPSEEKPDAWFQNGAVALPPPAGCVPRARRDEPSPPSPELGDHRKRFAGLRKYRRWSQADAVYFFGYALVTYLSLPFVLRSLPLVALSRARHRGEELLGLTVDFPPGFPTHCRRQRFFFDRDGLLVRHDYTADVIGAWAFGAHFSTDYEEVEGMPFARGRLVRLRLGGLVTPLPVLSARLAGFAVTWATPA